MTEISFLCAGLFNNSLSLILEMLILSKNSSDKKVLYATESAGIDDYARNSLPFPDSLSTVAQDLGFYISRQNPIHHNLRKELSEKGLTILYRDPKHINEITVIGHFNFIVTPYRTVYDRLQSRSDFDHQKLILACIAGEIVPGVTPMPEAFKKMQAWADTFFS